jgi:hypothetical protein
LAMQPMLRNSIVRCVGKVGLRANSDMARPRPLRARTILPKSSRAVDLASAVGPHLQVANQLDLFLRPCLITSRYNVIPPGYKRQHEVDSSHRLLAEQDVSRVRPY